jgi:hypothetical protein
MDTKMSNFSCFVFWNDFKPPFFVIVLWKLESKLGNANLGVTRINENFEETKFMISEVNKDTDRVE